METFSSKETKEKSFWERPEGVTGMIFLAGLIIGGGYLLYTILPVLIGLAGNILYLSLMLMAIAAIVYVVLLTEQWLEPAHPIPMILASICLCTSSLPPPMRPMRR